jgi:hypothetical protein
MSLRLLLHRLSLTKAEAELIPATAAALREASFIDGRIDFSCGPARVIALSELLRSEQVPAPPARMIFNTGFCGSTLLARLLDVPGEALVLREPNCLADLANQQAAAERQGTDLDGLGDVAGAILRHLSRPWIEGETVVVKPSSWANNLVPLLVGTEPIHPLFLVSTRDSYLKSVFRGGPERLSFAARAAVHLSSAGDEGARLVDAALRADDDQIGQLARVAMVGFEIQLRQFHAASASNAWGPDHWLDQAELMTDPLAAARKAAAALALDLGAELISANVDAWSARHAKSPRDHFSRGQEEEAFAAMPEGERRRVADTLAWAASSFGS